MFEDALARLIQKAEGLAVLPTVTCAAYEDGYDFAYSTLTGEHVDGTLTVTYVDGTDTGTQSRQFVVQLADYVGASDRKGFAGFMDDLLSA